MLSVALRIAVLAGVGGGAWLAVVWWQRRGTAGLTRLPSGLTLVTGPGCGLCGPVERALTRAGVKLRVTDVAAIDLAGIRSLPVALVVDHRGAIVMRRSGRAALDDAPELVARALAL